MPNELKETNMLVQKQNEDPLTQKIIFLGTMLVLVFFLIKYLKRMSKTTYDMQDPGIITGSTTGIPESSPVVKSRPPSPPKEDKRSRKAKRRRTHFHEEWLPKDVVGTYNAK